LNFPVSFITNQIRVYRRQANKQAYTAAYDALLVYTANCDPEKSPKKTIADFLPFPSEAHETMTHVSPLERGLPPEDYAEVVKAMKEGYFHDNLKIALCILSPKLARTIGH
jgi:hypothetical protein